MGGDIKRNLERLPRGTGTPLHRSELRDSEVVDRDFSLPRAPDSFERDGSRFFFCGALLRVSEAVGWWSIGSQL